MEFYKDNTSNSDFKKVFSTKDSNFVSHAMDVFANDTKNQVDFIEDHLPSLANLTPESTTELLKKDLNSVNIKLEWLSIDMAVLSSSFATVFVQSNGYTLLSLNVRTLSELDKLCKGSIAKSWSTLITAAALVHLTVTNPELDEDEDDDMDYYW